MRRQTAEVRARIVDAAYESFWRLGFRRTSVDAIAARAGLTKRTVYAYFRSKDDLLAAVLLRYEELARGAAAAYRRPLPADRVGLIDSFFAQLAGWASATPRWSGSGFTRLVMELGDCPVIRRGARAARQGDHGNLARRGSPRPASRMRGRARELMLLMEGSMALTLIHGDRDYIDAAAVVARQLVGRGASRSEPGAARKVGSWCNWTAFKNDRAPGIDFQSRGSL